MLKPNILEHGQKCTGWFDRGAGCDWGFACKRHDKLYATTRGAKLTRYQADLILARGVWRVCKPMAVVMFVGIRLTGWRLWDILKSKREGV